MLSDIPKLHCLTVSLATVEMIDRMVRVCHRRLGRPELARPALMFWCECLCCSDLACLAALFEGELTIHDLGPDLTILTALSGREFYIPVIGRIVLSTRIAIQI